MCSAEVTDDDWALECDKCNQWSHIECCDINDEEYMELQNKSSFVWHCPGCEFMNFSDSIFHLGMQLDDENSFRILNELNLSLDSNNDLQSPTIDFGGDTTSSPRKASVQMPNPKKHSKGASRRNLRDKHVECNLKFICLNAWSLRGKIPEFHALIDEHRPDVVCVSETHLDSTIPTYEIFPDYFNVYRKD